MFFIGLRLTFEKNQKKLQEKLEYLSMLIENMDEIFFTADLTGRLISINKKVTEVLGYQPQEMLGRNVLEFVHPDEIKKVQRVIDEGFFHKKGNIHYESVAIHKDGSKRYMWVHVSPIVESGKITGVMVLAEDITEKKLARERLDLQQVYFRQLFESSPDAIVILDQNDVIIDANQSFQTLFEYSADEIKGKRINELIVPEHLMNEANSLSALANSGNRVQEESIRRSKSGRMIYVSILGYPIFSKGKQIGVYGIYNDITHRKIAEERLKYFSLHDALTRVYNRTFFEQKMKRIAENAEKLFGIVVCDVDGLKLINDTLGHDNGDIILIAAAKAIKSSFGEIGITARIGGDEFAVLLEESNEAEIKECIRRLREAVDTYNCENPELRLTISIGYALNPDGKKKVGDLFKEADRNMYREKLTHIQSMRNTIGPMLAKALENRDFFAEGHAERMEKWILKLSLRLGIPEYEMANLRLFAHFHDIGKVGVPDNILNHPGPLTEEERMEIQRHSEIGYRIAQSVPDLLPIADWILKHHEWWNGQGYPLGLKEEEIPLQARILAIVDAFDAMTHRRPYREAMSLSTALEELERNAGKQFDPQLVPVFVSMIKNDAG